MHKLGFKRDVSIYYNRVMANIILKEGGEIINEIDIKNDEIDGKKVFSQFPNTCLACSFDVEKKALEVLEKHKDKLKN